MVREAVVVYENGRWQAKIERSEACAGCHQCDFGKKESMLIPLDGDGYRAGDTVTVTIPDRKVTHTALILYGIPLVLFLAGLALGYLLFRTDAASIIGALAGLGVSVIPLRLLGKKLTVEPKIAPCTAKTDDFLVK